MYLPTHCKGVWLDCRTNQFNSVRSSSTALKLHLQQWRTSKVWQFSLCKVYPLCLFSPSPSLDSPIIYHWTLTITITQEVFHSSISKIIGKKSNKTPHRTCKVKHLCRVPVMALILNLTSLPEDLPNKFDGEVMCSVDFSAIGMARPSDGVLNRMYEIPTEAITTIKFRLWNVIFIQFAYCGLFFLCNSRKAFILI